MQMEWGFRGPMPSDQARGAAKQRRKSVPALRHGATT